MSYSEYFDTFQEPEPRFFNRKPKDIYYWTTGQGEMIPLKDMEDSHIQNTINYLTRRSFEWEHSRQRAADNGVDLGEMIINNRRVDVWLLIFYAEVKRRQEQL